MLNLMNEFLSFLFLSYTLSREVSPFLKHSQPLSTQAAPPILKTQGLVIKCFWFYTKNLTIFDLKRLENNIDYSYYFLSKTNKKVHYNFCGNVIKKQCHSKDYQVISSEDNEANCFGMGGPYKEGNTWDLLDPSNYTKGLKITLNSGEKCGATDANYSLIYEIQCDATQKELLLLNANEFDDTKCANTLKFSTQYGCADESILSVYKFFSGKEMIFASVLIIVGLFELFLGKKLLTPTTYIISAASLTGLVFLFIIQFTIPAKAVNAVLWAALSISIIVGLVAAYFISYYKDKILGFMLGAFSGYLIGTVIYTTVTCKLFPDQPTWTNILTVLATMIIFVVITMFFFKHIIIFGTALVGSFFIVFGAGLFIGKFPSITLLMQLIKNGEKEQWSELFTVWMYCYAAAWLLLFIGGVVCQYYLTKEDKEEDERSESMTGKGVN